MNSKDLWQSPVYQFKLPAGKDVKGNELIKEVVVDVTTSAPSFGETTQHSLSPPKETQCYSS